MKKPKGPDLTGQRFGRLTVIEYAGGAERGAMWRCACDCGGEVTKFAARLKQSKVPGCPACEYERRGAAHVTHGECRKEGASRLYIVWQSMWSRCNYVGDTNFGRYGGRGIVVDPSWSDYGAFRGWAHANGYADGLTIERRNPDGNYCPQNCEWITRSENARRGWTSRSPEEQLLRRKANWEKRRDNKKAAAQHAAAMLGFGA